ncbi:MAG TPA: BamA/TamA family outer membrane protein [Myxococcota bacterium]|nr:BamA/TamA family outer membrane protein [Myxococcota bacterium]
MGSGLIALWLGLAGASEGTWYLDLPVAQVQVEAARGELPRESLLPLLTVRAGETLRREDLRSDLAVLYSTGAFEGAAVDVEPWFRVDEAGRSHPAVLVVYRVTPAPTLRRVRVSGARRLARREVSAATGLVRGDHVPANVEIRVTIRVLGLAAEAGLDETSAEVRVIELDDGRVDLLVELVEGQPVVLEEIVFTESPVSPARLRLAARRAGLAEGEPLRARDVRAARDAVEAVLVEAGYLEARVGAVLPEGERRGTLVTFVVSAGPRLRIEARGDVSARRLRPWLRLEGEGRIDASLAPVLEARVTRALQDEGYLDAESVNTVEPGGGLVVHSNTVAGPRYRLARGGLAFVGNSNFDSDWLAAAAVEASPDVLGRGRLSDNGLAQAVDALEATYAAEGFLDAEVSPGPIQKEGTRLSVVMNVDEGTRTELVECRVSGAAPSLEAALLALAAELEGQPYRPLSVQQLVQHAMTVHRDAGFATVDARARTHIEDGRAHVVVEVDSGERLVLRNVIVRGNRRVRTGVVMREIPLQTGEFVTPDRLDGARSNLYDLDSFRSVDLSLQGEGAHVRDLVVSLDEKPSWSVELGAGVATDEGVRTYGSVSRRNLFGVAHRVSLLGQVGLGYGSTGWALDPTALEWRAGLRYDAPHTPTLGQLSWIELLANQREQEPTFRLARSGVGTGTQYELGELRLNGSYGVQLRRMEDVDPGALVPGDPWLDGKATRRRGALSVEALLDRRDDPFDPSRGVVASVEIDLVEPLTSIDGWMFRGLAQGEALVPVGPLRVGLGGELGVGMAPGRGTTLPLEERFRLGGAGSLRGYPVDSVGPKMRVADLDLGLPDGVSPLVDLAARDRSERWVPTGGEALVRGSAELIVPLSLVGAERLESTALVTFVDVGNVYFLDPEVFATSEAIDPEPLLRYGVGVGLRQATPLGPLRLDVGVNPVYFQEDWAQPRGEVPARLHLSLGTL